LQLYVALFPVLGHPQNGGDTRQLLIEGHTIEIIKVYIWILVRLYYRKEVALLVIQGMCGDHDNFLPSSTPKVAKDVGHSFSVDNSLELL